MKNKIKLSATALIIGVLGLVALFYFVNNPAVTKKDATDYSIYSFQEYATSTYGTDMRILKNDEVIIPSLSIILKKNISSRLWKFLRA